MPKRAQNIISWQPDQGTYLATEVNSATRFLTQEDIDWQKWLAEHDAFAFHGSNGRINLLKEKRSRGRAGYWYAYRRYQGRMIKYYVGGSALVTIKRLEALAILPEQHPQNKPLKAEIRADYNGVSPSSINSVKDAVGEHIELPDTQTSMPIQFEPLLMTKLQLPRPQKSLLPREQLLALLDRGLASKVTLIAGPAGYGKTSLVNQWIEARSTHEDFPRIASVTLDEGDNDPILFWRYLIAACEQFSKGIANDALALLLAHLLPPFKPLEMMLTVLLNALSQLEHPSILILDDLHVISSPQITAAFSFFLEHLPTSFHLILLVRGDPPFSLARLRAHNELLEIYPPDLGFTLEETRTFFAQELSFTLSSRALRQIYDLLDGWPAGLRLLAKDMRWPNDVQSIESKLTSSSGSFWSIQEYFLHEVLHTLSQEQQKFLLQSCFLPRVTAPLCNAIMDRDDSALLLDVLRGGDLFLIPLDGIGAWFRYHSLFAEAMQQEARRCLGEEHLRSLAIRASTWYEEQGYLVEAIECAISAATFARSANLVERFIESKRQSTAPESYRLSRWLARLPDKELECCPDLCVHYAMALLFIYMEEGPRVPDRSVRIYALLQMAEQQWRDANKTEKLAEVFAFRALLARQEGKLLQAVTWARQSLAWLPREDITWRNLSLTVVGMGEILDGNLDLARTFLIEALTLSEQQGNLMYARATRGMLSGASVEQGKLHHAAEQFQQMQMEARVQEDYDDIAHTQLALARIAYQWNRLEEAELRAQEALAIGERMHVEEFQALATVYLARIEQARGQDAQAQQRLIAWLALNYLHASPYSYQLSREIQATLARLQLASGNLVAVEHWFSSIEKREDRLPLLQSQRERLLQARLHLLQGKIPTAQEALESLSTSALQTGHHYLKLEVQLVQALAHAHQGEREQARKHLYELVEFARNEGDLRLFLDEGEEMVPLLRQLLLHLRAKPLLACVGEILSAFASESKTPASESPHAVLLLAPLSPQEQKVLRLLAAGNTNPEIANELVVSVNTVRTQIQSIYRKLNVNNRFEATRAATQLASKSPLPPTM